MDIKTADLCDQHEGKLQIAQPLFKSFGIKKSFGGRIVTVKVFEDNVLVKKMLGENGTGKVLVVDGGGSLRCALMGDLLGEIAVKNEWEGVIIYGCIRDSDEINRQQIGVKALNTNPQKSVKGGVGEVNIPVKFADVTFQPEAFVYSDEDGIIVSAEKLL